MTNSRAEYHKEYYEEHKEQKREYHKKWFQKNKEKRREYKIKYREENREKIREKQREYDKKYREGNREKIAEYARKYREENREYTNKCKRGYNKKKKAICVEYLGGKCVKCGTTKRLEFDHIKREGKKYDITPKLTINFDILKEELDKCQLLCYDCHKIKTKSERTK